MIKANELRIGNLIKYRISDRFDKRKEWWEVSKIYADDIHWLSKVMPEDENFKAIPLSKEWLEKLGFKFIIRNMWEMKIDFCTKLQFYDNQNDYITLHIKNYKDMVFDSETYAYFKHIKHVHELQNLYFALTGSELTVSDF